MKRSLTVVLPVRDAQSTLADTVTRVLEMASDVSEQFELLIIDDASSDTTRDVARELARQYPQIRTMGFRTAVGQEAALRLGMAQSRGDAVFVRDLSRPIFERLPLASKPVRPNFLGRSRSMIRSGI